MKTYYETLSDGHIGCFTTNEELAKKYSLTQETERKIVMAWDGKNYFEGEVPAKPVTFADYDSAMETHLDAEKAARGYTKREPSDYAGSSNPRWAQDAQDWIVHRDAVMTYGLDVENKAARGEPVPTLDEFKTNLPIITWTFDVSDQ